MRGARAKPLLKLGFTLAVLFGRFGRRALRVHRVCRSDGIHTHTGDGRTERAHTGFLPFNATRKTVSLSARALAHRTELNAGALTIKVARAHSGLYPDVARDVCGRL